MLNLDKMTTDDKIEYVVTTIAVCVWDLSVGCAVVKSDMKPILKVFLTSMVLNTGREVFDSRMRPLKKKYSTKPTTTEES